MVVVFVVLASACLALVCATQQEAGLDPSRRSMIALRGLSLASYVATVLAAGHVFNTGWPGGERPNEPCLWVCTTEPIHAVAWQVTFLSWGAALFLLWPSTRAMATAGLGVLAPLGWLTWLVLDVSERQTQGRFPAAWLGRQGWGPVGQPMRVAAMVATGVVAVMVSQLRGRDWWWSLLLVPIGLLLAFMAAFSLYYFD